MVYGMNIHAIAFRKNFRLFMHVNQITRNQQEGGHMESIYDTFGIRILTSYMAQVKDDHEYDKQAFQIVQFMDTVPHDCIR